MSAIRASAPVTAPSGIAIHASRPSTLHPIATASGGPNGAGRAAAPCLTSQLRVKLGASRPPTSVMSAIRAPIAPRRLMSAAAPLRMRPWKAILAANSHATIASTRRLRQFLPATISRPATASTAARKAMSIAAVSAGPGTCGSSIAARPAIQIATSAASGQPATGRRPVQFGIAVNRKPHTTSAA